MDEEQLKEALIELLYDLHSVDKLNAYVLNSISKNFNIDAYDLCDCNGITYDLE